MKISTKVMNRILFSVVMLFLLAPLTVFPQDGFYVIPVAMNKPLKKSFLGLFLAFRSNLPECRTKAKGKGYLELSSHLIR